MTEGLISQLGAIPVAACGKILFEHTRARIVLLDALDPTRDTDGSANFNCALHILDDVAHSPNTEGHNDWLKWSYPGVSARLWQMLCTNHPSAEHVVGHRLTEDEYDIAINVARMLTSWRILVSSDWGDGDISLGVEAAAVKWRENAPSVHAMQTAAMLYDAAHMGDVEAVNHLIDGGVSPNLAFYLENNTGGGQEIYEDNTDGATHAIQAAVLGNQPRMVEHLIGRGARFDVHELLDLQCNPLLLAFRYSGDDPDNPTSHQPEVMAALLRGGCPIDVRDEFDQQGNRMDLVWYARNLNAHAAAAMLVAERSRRWWAKVRDMVIRRGICFYWLEKTQRALCAPGGDGRKRDRSEFEKDFTGQPTE